MKNSKIIIILAVIILVGIAAYAVGHSTKNNNPSSNTTNSSTSTNQQSSSTGTSAATINIRNMMFTPSQITVQKGQTVTWTNNDTVAHTVVADLGNGPDSGDINPGSSYSYTFNKIGSVQYHCSIHPSMRGTIVVQ